MKRHFCSHFVGKLYWEKHFQEPLDTFRDYPAFQQYVGFLLLFYTKTNSLESGVGKIGTFTWNELRNLANLECNQAQEARKGVSS